MGTQQRVEVIPLTTIVQDRTDSFQMPVYVWNNTEELTIKRSAT